MTTSTPHKMGYNTELCNLLMTVPTGSVVMEPFPHLVVKNALPDELAQQLTGEYPEDDVIIEACPEAPTGSNKRLDIYAHDVAINERISPLWKAFIEEQSSQRFFQQAVRLFGPALQQYYPGLIDHYGRSLEKMRAGVRFREDYSDKDVLLDAGISINTPVTTIPTSVRNMHVDLPTKLFSALYYLRPPADQDTRGGDLLLCRFRKDVPKRFWQYDVEPGCCEVVRTVPYENNVIVMFLNSIDSLHSVTPRQHTSHTRKFVNLVVELEHDLFDSSQFQVAHVPYRAKYYLRQLFSWSKI